MLIRRRVRSSVSIKRRRKGVDDSSSFFLFADDATCVPCKDSNALRCTAQGSTLECKPQYYPDNISKLWCVSSFPLPFPANLPFRRQRSFLDLPRWKLRLGTGRCGDGMSEVSGGGGGVRGFNGQGDEVVRFLPAFSPSLPLSLPYLSLTSAHLFTTRLTLCSRHCSSIGYNFFVEAGLCVETCPNTQTRIGCRTFTFDEE
jgi:hypothetical protein